ncbi:hypothetical protein ASC89_00045 [Devosia sp. Root413D1]|jgi:hypothetical protein|uniref:hypothetical protein n=1 Tax=unclassified Devosia TaxID=196773 RepID=UPI0006F3ADB2|nr:MULTISPECIES: hypothetical protein [unclassified Devosia]KQV09641.1 hypothetical protein ASC68_04970 [Devosia sp. Root105]KQW85516.1 hypothetical protein ASC89_00045 [Devosia sp. Root413D1]
MVRILSGLALFVVVIALTCVMLVGFSYAMGYGAPSFDFDSLLPITAVLVAFALANSIVLVVLAWRGRNRPLSDGVLSLNVLVIGFTLVTLVSILLQGPSPYPDSMPMYYVMLMGGQVVTFLIPAHIVAVLALSRTPLLRGFVPKAKGPAEASP